MSLKITYYLQFLHRHLLFSLSTLLFSHSEKGEQKEKKVRKGERKKKSPRYTPRVVIREYVALFDAELLENCADCKMLFEGKRQAMDSKTFCPKK